MLLVITDRLSKGVILIPILLIFAPVVAAAFIERYILYYGFLKAIIVEVVYFALLRPARST